MLANHQITAKLKQDPPPKEYYVNLIFHQFFSLQISRSHFVNVASVLYSKQKVTEANTGDHGPKPVAVLVYFTVCVELQSFSAPK